MVGGLVETVLYGFVIVLFFRCMNALLDPMKGTIKWGLAAHTMAMFALVTVATAITLHIQAISYIDGREFPGTPDSPPPGPLGYQGHIYSDAISVVSNVAFLLNNWLADGLLLYRCYIIYAKNYWVVAFPGLMYLACVVLGIMLTYYQVVQTNSTTQDSVAVNLGTPYYSLSLSLNVLLTIIIVIRLFRHRKEIKDALGYRVTNGSLYDAIILMFIESSALYAATFLMFIGPWGTGSWVAGIFFPILIETQAIAPFLIILRVANRSALTSDILPSMDLASLHFRSRGRSLGVETTADEFPMSSMGTCAETADELSTRVETITDTYDGKE